MTDRETMSLALDALEDSMYPQKKQFNAIVALKQALAQPEQIEIKQGWDVDTLLTKAKQHIDVGIDVTDIGTQLVVRHCNEIVKSEFYHAPKREWVGLTDNLLMREFGYTDELLKNTAYRVDQLLKWKNT